MRWLNFRRRAAEAREEERLAALRACAILDTPPDPVFDRIAARVCELLGVPIAMVSLADAKRHWFKAKVGIDYCESPRDVAVCSYALESAELFEICDASLDHRSRNNPRVTGDPYARYYVIAPLVAEGGHVIGTLCALDTRPRPPLDEARREAFEALAREAVAEIERYRQRAAGKA